MKRLFTITVAACALACAASEMISGAYNTTLGYLAGSDANGEKITAVGAAAAGESWANNRTTFTGAASGVGSYYLTDTIGIGYRALRNAHHMTNVVAIGSSAFAGEDNHTDATWINGHFYAENGRGLYLRENNRQSEGTSSLVLSNGVAVLRGDLVVTGDIWRRSDGKLPGAIETPVYDFYVSQLGDDSLPGTEAAPFGTIGGALSNIQAKIDAGTITNRFYTIGVARGEYEYPGDIPSVGAGFYALDGNARTFIKPLSTNSAQRVTKPNSGVVYLTEFNGFTFEDFTTDTRFSGGSSAGVWFKRSAFFLCAFKNCIFRNADINGKPKTPTVNMHNYTFIFNACVLDECEVEPTVVPLILTGDNKYGNNPGISDNIYLSEVYNSVIRFGQPETTVSMAKPFSANTLFDNCYLSISKTGSYYTFRGTSSYKTVFGNIPEIRNCTVDFDASRRFTLNHMGEASYNNLLRVGSGMPSLTDSMTTQGNKFVASAEFNEDYRPTDYSLRWYGYNSDGDRGLRNALIGEIVNALNDNGQPTVAARMSLMALPPKYASSAPDVNVVMPELTQIVRISNDSSGGDEADTE